MEETVHIPVNKMKLLFHTVIFSGIGIALLIGCFSLAESSEMSPIIWQGAGILLCLIAVLAAGAKAKKRADKSAGIIFSTEGMTDNSSDFGLGLIRWKDIKGLNADLSLQSKLLIVEIKNQSEYLKRGKNSAVKRLLDQNVRKFGTPIVIEVGNLDCDIAELVEVFQDQMKKFK